MREYFVWLAKLITLVILIFFVIPMVLAAATFVAKQAMEDKPPSGEKVVAVVELKGLIDSSKEILQELYKQVSKKNIKGIVLRIDSPGGAVAPSQDIYSAVKVLKKRKPIVASMGSVAASGGLYSALSSSKVFCEPGTLTGSIGVIIQFPNVRKLTDLVGLSMVTVKSGKLKDVGNSFRDITPEEEAFLQGTVNSVHQDFVAAVAEGRNLTRERVLEFADGRVILGSQAKELKLVDEFGDVYDAARAVFDILGEPLKADEVPKLYYPQDKFSEIREIFEAVGKIPEIVYGSRNLELKYLMY